MNYKKNIVTLTPLLDLLLIVIFALQFDIKSDAEEQISNNKKLVTQFQQEAENAKGMQNEFKIRTENLVEKLQIKEEQLAIVSQSNNEIKQQKQQLLDENLQLKSKLNVAQEEKLKAQEQIVELAHRISDVLDISQEVFNEVLKELSPEEQREIKKEVDKLTKDEAKQIVNRLNQLASLSNYVVFWKIVLLADNSVEVEFEEKQVERFYFNQQNNYSSDLFSREIEEVRKQVIGEPQKSVVLITYGYSKGSTVFAWNKLKMGMENWRTLLRADWSTKKFYFSNIGLVL